MGETLRALRDHDCPHGGLPGAGKTTLARELASGTSGRVLSKDEIRHALFSPDEIEYSSWQDDFCLQLMLETAGHLLQRHPGRILFLDGRPFSRRYQIDNVINAAVALHQSWRILECVCPEEIARRRLAEQSASGAHPAGNRGFQLYLEVKSRFEAITLPKTVIDTSQPLQDCIERALASLR
jgi:predicted kinase